MNRSTEAPLCEAVLFTAVNLSSFLMRNITPTRRHRYLHIVMFTLTVYLRHDAIIKVLRMVLHEVLH